MNRHQLLGPRVPNLAYSAFRPCFRVTLPGHGSKPWLRYRRRLVGAFNTFVGPRSEAGRAHHPLAIPQRVVVAT